MTPGELLHDLVFDYTLRTVALGSGLLGLASGVLGSFAVLRRQSLLGDTVSHTALPGIALAFLVTGSKAPLVMLLGAALAGWIGMLLVLAIIRTTRLTSDSAFGITLSVFFGFGLVLLTFIQKQPNARQAGLEKFLFGQATALMQGDVIVMAITSALLLLLVVLFFKEFKLIAFDSDYGATIGFPVRAIDFGLTSAIVVAIVLGLQTVGVVLMSAMVVAPAAAARQWTDRLSRMVLLAALFGALSGIAGAVISSSTARLPTGPVIVLCASALVLLSLTLAPNRGLLWQLWRRQRNRRRLAVTAVLLDLYELALQHRDPAHPHPAATLAAMSFRPSSVPRSLAALAEQGWVERLAGVPLATGSPSRSGAPPGRGSRAAHGARGPGADLWHLTPIGWQEARRRAAEFGSGPPREQAGAARADGGEEPPRPAGRPGAPR